MSSLSRRWSWKKWAPDIGENRELEAGPVLFLELASGLSGGQMKELGALLAKVREVPYVAPVIPEGATGEEVAALVEAAGRTYLEALRAALVVALSSYVRVHAGPHTVDGMQLATLDDYLRIAEQSADMGVNARLDLEQALVRFNSIEGHDELFLPRSSGGARITARRRTATTAAH